MIDRDHWKQFIKASQTDKRKLDWLITYLDDIDISRRFLYAHNYGYVTRPLFDMIREIFNEHIEDVKKLKWAKNLLRVAARELDGTGDATSNRIKYFLENSLKDV